MGIQKNTVYICVCMACYCRVKKKPGVEKKQNKKQKPKQNLDVLAHVVHEYFGLACRSRLFHDVIEQVPAVWVHVGARVQKLATFRFAQLERVALPRTDEPRAMRKVRHVVLTPGVHPVFNRRRRGGGGGGGREI